MLVVGFGSLSAKLRPKRRLFPSLACRLYVVASVGWPFLKILLIPFHDMSENDCRTGAPAGHHVQGSSTSGHGGGGLSQTVLWGPSRLIFDLQLDRSFFFVPVSLQFLADDRAGYWHPEYAPGRHNGNVVCPGQSGGGWGMDAAGSGGLSCQRCVAGPLVI